MKGVGVVLGAVLLFAPGADAATFGVTSTANSGAGSLRQAVLDANLTPAADSIAFASSVTGDIALSSQILITAPVTVTGPGRDALSITGGDTTRLLDVAAGSGEVRLSRLELADGFGQGAAVRAASAAGTPTHLTLDGVRVTSNVANGAVPSDGGAVRLTGVDGTLAVVRTEVVTNSGTQLAGVAVAGAEGLTIDHSVLAGNTSAGDGGGLHADHLTGDVTITDSTFGSNTGAGGGGIHLSELLGTVTVTGSTISGNTASGSGGGVLISETSGVVFENTTITQNTAAVTGGAVLADGAAPSASLTFTGVTIAANSAAGAADGLATDNATGWPITVRDSVLADGAGEDLTNAGNATITAAYSLIEDSGTTILATGDHVLTGSDPALGPLADNGGLTRTMLPGAASPLLDAGKAFGLTTDQRGRARPIDRSPANAGGGDGSDIGAVEIAPDPTALTATVPGSPSFSLAPKVQGTAPLGTATVRLYTTADCSGLPVATASAAELAGGVTVAVRAGTTTFYAQGFDAMGFSTGCSASGLVYLADIGPPDLRAPNIVAGVAGMTITGQAGVAERDQKTVSIRVRPVGAGADNFTATAGVIGGAYSQSVSPLAQGRYDVVISQADTAGNRTYWTAYAVVVGEVEVEGVPSVGRVTRGGGSAERPKVTVRSDGAGRVQVLLTRRVRGEEVRIGTAKAVFFAAGAKRVGVKLTATGAALLATRASLTVRWRAKTVSDGGRATRRGSVVLPGLTA